MTTTPTTPTTDLQACILQANHILAKKETRPSGAIIRMNDKGLDTGWAEIVKVAADCSRNDLEPGDRVVFKDGMKHTLDGQEYLIFEVSSVKMVLKKGAGAPRSVEVAPNAPPPAPAAPADRASQPG